MNHPFFDWLNKMATSLFKPAPPEIVPRATVQIIETDNDRHYDLLFVTIDVEEYVTKILLHSVSRSVTIILNFRLQGMRRQIYYPETSERGVLDVYNVIRVIIPNLEESLIVELTGDKETNNYSTNVSTNTNRIQLLDVSTTYEVID